MLKKLLLVSALLSLSLALATAAAAAKGKPRLSVAKVNAPPASVDPGDEFTVKGKLRNRGKTAFGGSDEGLVIQLRIRHAPSSIAHCNRVRLRLADLLEQ